MPTALVPGDASALIYVFTLPNGGSLGKGRNDMTNVKVQSWSSQSPGLNVVEPEKVHYGESGKLGQLPSGFLYMPDTLRTKLSKEDVKGKCVDRTLGQLDKKRSC